MRPEPPIAPSNICPRLQPPRPGHRQRHRDGLVAADVLVLAAIVSFVAVVLTFGWWRARQAEPPARGPAVPVETLVSMPVHDPGART